MMADKVNKICVERNAVIIDDLKDVQQQINEYIVLFSYFYNFRKIYVYGISQRLLELR